MSKARHVRRPRRERKSCRVRTQLVEREVLEAAASLLRSSVPGVVAEDVAHRPGRERGEVGAARRSDPRLAHQLREQDEVLELLAAVDPREPKHDALIRPAQGDGALAERILALGTLGILEVAQVLRRCERAGELSAQRGREALEDLGAFRIERYPHHLFLDRVWSLRANATAYDACYLALAKALDAPLITRDRRLAAASGHRAAIEVPGVV